MNYQTCTIEELIQHVQDNTTQAITQQLMYYRKLGNEGIVRKIMKARLIAKQEKLAKKLEGL